MTYAWLLFAICCLGIAGSFAFLVAMTRTPGIRLLPSAQSFNVVLVGHVTFALIIWGLAFIAALWCHAHPDHEAGRTSPARSSAARWGLVLAAVGCGTILASILLGRGPPRLNDYVPVLDEPLFFIGYAAFAAGILLTLFRYLWAALRGWQALSLFGFGLVCAAACLLIAGAALAIALLRVLPSYDAASGPLPYQAIFWGAGHALQYAYVAAMVVAWQKLAAELGAPPVNQLAARMAYSLYPLFAASILFIYALYKPTEVPMLTRGSAWLGVGLSLPTLLHVLTLAFAAAGKLRATLPTWISRFRHGGWRPEASALAFSLLLYGVGSLLEPSRGVGTLRVPAHYHGVVVGGMTMAFMGMSYNLLPKIGAELHSRRVARWQPILYGTGVAILIAGLAWAGTAGAPRKTFDAAADTTGAAWLLPMGLMGLGSFLAVTGGAAFVVNMLISLISHRPSWVTSGRPEIRDHAVRDASNL